MNGDTYHGIGVFGRGVFTGDEDDTQRYAGQYRDGYACGLGVHTWPSGSKEYSEHGPDGQRDGRYLERNIAGYTRYGLCERGKWKEIARVQGASAHWRCDYNRVRCAPDDPRVLALIAQVAPVEVRAAAPAPHSPLAPHSPPCPR